MEINKKLTAAQLERLTCLSEECGEVIQAVSKIIRFGFDSRNPKDPGKGTKKTGLEIELGDLLHIVDMLTDNGDLSHSSILLSASMKAEKMKPYLYHQDKDQ